MLGGIPKTEGKGRIYLVCGVWLVFCMIAGISMVWSAGPQGLPPAPVEVDRVVRKVVRKDVHLVGTVRPWLESRVASEVAGRVSVMEVEEGDPVRKGEALCRLDSKQLVFRIRSAEADLAEARVRLEQARKERDRQKALVRTKSVSRKAYDDALAAFEAAGERVKRLEAERSRLRDLLEKKTVRAPFSGVVVQKYTDVGEWVAEGAAVVRLFMVSPLRVVVPVPERYVTSLSKGDRVVVEFDALKGRKWEGRVHAVVPMGDDAARTFPVHVRLDGSRGEVKPGMLARVSLNVGAPRPALLVAKDALVLSGERRIVFKSAQGKAVPVPVRIEGEYGERVAVSGDLKAGDLVVVRGNERLIPG